MLDPLELVGDGGTVVVGTDDDVVAVEPGTTMTAGRVVEVVANVVAVGADVVGFGTVVGVAAVVGTVVRAGAVVGAGGVVVAGVSGRDGRVDAVVSAATASVVVEPPPKLTVGPVAIGCSGRGADGLELPDPHADIAAAPSTTTAKQRIRARRAASTPSKQTAGRGSRMLGPFRTQHDPSDVLFVPQISCAFVTHRG